ASHGLDSHRRQHRSKLTHVSTTAGMAKALAHLMTKTSQQIHANEIAVLDVDLAAILAKRGRVERGFGCDDVELTIDGDAQPHMMHWLASGVRAVAPLEFVAFDIDQLSFNIDQAVAAQI